MNFNPVLENNVVHTSVPCRVDFGGTLDIPTLFLTLSHLKPVTFNIALDLRTHVRLSTWENGRIKISSKGFDTIERGRDDRGLDNPMGLMFAVAQYFNAHGVHIQIDSASPPRSALGGSSSAATALIAAFYTALGKQVTPGHVAWLAHYLESCVAGVPCGVQDQTAAAFGGAHLWEWGFKDTGPVFKKQPLYTTKEKLEKLNSHMLVAYCGIPHASKNVNAKWVSAFKNGSAVDTFKKIIILTRSFASALAEKDFESAAQLMTRETRMRSRLTPEVLDNTGKKLFETAVELNCGARFTGAGGGGCLWAVGDSGHILKMRTAWQQILDLSPGGCILDTAPDSRGILTHNN